MLGGVDVEQPQLARTGVSEPVDDADRGGDVRAAAGADGLAADSEFGFALEDVEGVDMVGVAVLVDARELWSEAQLDYLEFGQLGEDAVVAGAARASRLRRGRSRSRSALVGPRVSSGPAGPAELVFGSMLVLALRGWSGARGCLGADVRV